MEDGEALLIGNRGSIRCRFVFHIARREIQYALSSVALAGKGERRLLSEGLPASRTSPSDNETKDRLNQRVAKDVELARTSLMTCEQAWQGFTDRATRQLTADLVPQHVVAILFDFGTGSRAWTWHGILPLDWIFRVGPTLRAVYRKDVCSCKCEGTAQCRPSPNRDAG